MAKQPQRRDDEDDERGAYGPGFVASAIVLTAVLLCGVLVVVARLAGGAPASAASPAPAVGPAAGPDRSGTTAGPPSAAPSRGARTTNTRGGCRLPDGDQAVPAGPPAGAEWVVYRRMVVPRSGATGPAVVDADGFRHCCAHSPTGALYAAYNAVAALDDNTAPLPTARKLLLPGPDRDRMLAEIARDGGSSSNPVQLTGFRIIDASRDRFSVALAMNADGSLASATLALAWYDGDWRVVPPRPGEEFGAPYTQLEDLSGFVQWGGL